MGNVTASGNSYPVQLSTAKWRYQWRWACRVAVESARRNYWCLLRARNGTIAIVDTEIHSEPIDVPYADIGWVRASKGQAVFRAGSPSSPPAIARLDLNSRKIETLRLSNSLNLDPGYFSVAQAIEFPTTDGLTAHGFYYPPQNRDYRGPTGERPPLGKSLEVQFAAATALSLNINFGRGGSHCVRFYAAVAAMVALSRRLTRRWAL